MGRRICVFCETWESGGIESFLCNMLSRMDLSGLEVDVVASCLKDSVFTQPLVQRGVRFRELSGSSRRVLENHRMFRRLLRERRYDVLHLNIFQGMSLYFAHLAKAAGVPVRIAHSHNTDLRQSKTRWIKLLIHKLFRQAFTADATELWACSEAAARFLFSPAVMTERSFHFIPNGIDVERFRFRIEGRHAARDVLGLSDELVIGNVGRLCYQKNQDFLLDVFAQVLKQQPKSRLLLVGEGEARAALEEKAEALGVVDAVIFYGVSENVEQLMWAMDAFAFPSRFEGLGIVAVEAQAAGLPVICSEYVPSEAHVTGLAKTIPLVAGAGAWAEALLQITRPEKERTTDADVVRDAGFGVVDVAGQIEAIYREAEN